MSVENGHTWRMPTNLISDIDMVLSGIPFFFSIFPKKRSLPAKKKF